MIQLSERMRDRVLNVSGTWPTIKLDIHGLRYNIVECLSESEKIARPVRRQSNEGYLHVVSESKHSGHNLTTTFFALAQRRRG